MATTHGIFFPQKKARRLSIDPKSQLNRRVHCCETLGNDALHHHVRPKALGALPAMMNPMNPKFTNEFLRTWIPTSTLHAVDLDPNESPTAYLSAMKWLKERPQHKKKCGHIIYVYVHMSFSSVSFVHPFSL